jgi:hypothetical protein
MSSNETINYGLQPIPVKTKEQILAERVVWLNSQTPYLRKQPAGMSRGSYRRALKMQNKEYELRRAGIWFWISADKLPTMDQIRDNIKHDIPVPKSGLAKGTYRKP